MDDRKFLHDLPEFRDVIVQINKGTGIDSSLIEKDYWLMHVLWALRDSGLRYELKGGTSLSKGWGVINRFSEDVDIKIFQPEEMQVHTSKNHTKPRHKESRRQYFGSSRNRVGNCTYFCANYRLFSEG